MHKFLARVGIILVLRICALQAQTTEPVLTDTQLIHQLLDEVRQLKARVHDLETKPQARTLSDPDAVQFTQSEANAPIPLAQTTSTVVQTATPETMDMSEDAHAQHSMLAAPTLTFHGYADLGYEAVSPNGGKSAFGLGQADIFVTSHLSPKLSFLMETAIDSDRQNFPGIEMERIFLTYRHNDYLSVDVGRYHSAIGYFNGAFHHGRWFQTAADRPFLFAFEDDGGILPIHNVGISASGRIPSGSLALNYVAEVGNGRSANPGFQPVQTTTAERNGRALNLALFATPHALPGWQFGTSFYRDRLTPINASPYSQGIYSAHAVYVRDRYEFLNEGILMKHAREVSAQGASTTHVPAMYTQFSYRLTAAGRPYVRYEYMNGTAYDPMIAGFLDGQGHRRTLTLGYRYDLSEFCALKFQVERLSRPYLGSITQGSVQFAFAF